MSYKAIIFDFFDVIHADPFHAWLRNHSLTREGEPAATSRDLDRGTIDAQEFFRRLGEVTGQTAVEVRQEMVSQEKLHHETVDLVRKLKQHYKIAVISNAESKHFRGLLHEHKLENLFDVIVVSSEVQQIKPEPEIFHTTLERLGVEPTEAVFLDDNPVNVTAAEAVGLTGIVFTDVGAGEQRLKELGVAV